MSDRVIVKWNDQMNKENDYPQLNMTQRCQDKFRELWYFSCVKIVVTRQFYSIMVESFTGLFLTTR